MLSTEINLLFNEYFANCSVALIIYEISGSLVLFKGVGTQMIITSEFLIDSYLFVKLIFLIVLILFDSSSLVISYI